MLRRWLDERFLVTERGSTLGTELRAGITTFMTMAYILVVNPSVLSNAGLPFGPVAFATAMCATTALIHLRPLSRSLPLSLSLKHTHTDTHTERETTLLSNQPRA